MEKLVKALSDARIEVLMRIVTLLKGKNASVNEKAELEKLDAVMEQVLGCYGTGEWRAKGVSPNKNGADADESEPESNE